MGKILLRVIDSCSAKCLRGYAHPAMSDANTPPNGKSTFDEVKSNRLKNVNEKILTSAIGPKLNAHRLPRIMLSPITVPEAFFRDHKNRSEQNDVEISAIDIVDVSDAMKSNMKNIGASIAPPGIAPKMAGRVSKTSVGPAVGDIPKLNTAGNMMMPDRIATRVSNAAMLTAVRGMLVDSLKYEP